MRGLRQAAWVVAGMALLGAMSGCSPASSDGAGSEIDVDAAWLDDGRLIGVVTWGSSSCSPVAESASVAADGAIEVTLSDPTAGDGTALACTADYAPRVSLVGAPARVDPADDAVIRVRYGAAAGSVTLAGADGLAGPGGATGYSPSAGWTGRAGTFAYLTWGSSSCAPVVKDVEATGEAQVTIAFAQAAADRVCTMDMAPRAGLAEATGLTAASGAELVLTGDTFDAVVVPIAGSPAAAASPAPTASDAPIA